MGVYSSETSLKNTVSFLRINTLRKEILSVLTALLLLPAPFCDADAKTVYIDIVGEGKFEVIYHRALTNATGAVIAGIVGAGIQSGIEHGKEKGKELSPLISKNTWKSQFLDTLNAKLESKGFEAIWIENTKDINEGTVVKVYPDQYGFRMINDLQAVLPIRDHMHPVNNGWF